MNPFMERSFSPKQIHIRSGGPHDALSILDLLDKATAWLTAAGRTEQWGSESWSSQPALVRRIRRYTRDLIVRVADIDGTAVGVCILSETPQPYVLPATEQELYIRLLVTDRSLVGHGIGRALVSDARAQAVTRGIRLLRTDCYDGDGALVKQYQRLGFQPAQPIQVDTPSREEPWPCRVLEMRM